jgi:hypothetical protein
MRAERFAYRGDVHLKRVISDDGARPDAIHQVILRYKLAGRLYQHLDDLERPSPDRDGHPTRPQLASRKIDFALACLIYSRVVLFRHCQNPWVTAYPALFTNPAGRKEACGAMLKQVSEYPFAQMTIIDRNWRNGLFRHPVLPVLSATPAREPVPCTPVTVR